MRYSRANSKTITAAFRQLAQVCHFHDKWQTSEQWADTLKLILPDVVAPVINDNYLNKTNFDKALKLDRVINANFHNYTGGTNSIGIMHWQYSPCSKTENVTKVYCYITLPL